MNVSLRKIHPELKRRILLLQKIASSYGIKSDITSAYRTYAQQKKLWENPEGYPVSRPGCTSHELGLAVDLVCRNRDDNFSGSPSQGQRFLMGIGEYLGLYTYPSDPIHFTLFSPADISIIRKNLCNL